MIILRKLKIFARRDEFPDDLRRKYTGGDYVNGTEDLKIYVDKSDRFKEQYKSQTPANCDIINEIINYIKAGFIFNDPENKNTDPHYLSDYSKTKVSRDPYVMFSKKINNEDRLNYKVQEPEIVEIGGKRYYFQKIVLDSCVGHSISGKPGSYVSGQIGNTWKKRKKKVKKNRFK